MTRLCVRMLAGVVCVWLFAGTAVVLAQDQAAESPVDVRDLTEQAQKGVAGAQFRLGMLYLEGDEVAQDFPQGVKLIQAAAKQNLAAAQNIVGDFYFHGVEDIPEDEQEAAKWYRLAAEQGWAEAQYSLGWMYFNGRGVRRIQRKQSGFGGLLQLRGR